MTEDDSVLYERFLKGDDPSYDELMLRHGDGLVGFLTGFLRDVGDAEDLMIEAFARIMVKRPDIYKNGTGSFKAYLYRTGRNLALRFAGNRRECFSLEEVPEPADASTPEILAERKERDRTLRLCLSRMDRKYREALWLVYCEGMSYAQTARVMGVSVKRVDKLLQTGKIRLREELAKEGITDIT